MEMISRMLDDTLWIYTAVAGSLFGAAFLFWFKDTKMATWAVAKFDGALEYLVIRWGWTWLQNDPLAWRKKYPRITGKIDSIEARLDQLEADSHPPKGLTDFDGYDELVKRIEELEGNGKR